MRHTTHRLTPALVGALLLASTPFASSMRTQGGGTFVATATLKTAGGVQVTAPVTVVVTRMSSEQQRATVIGAVKKGGTPALLQVLKEMPDAGYVEIGDHKTPLKYAYSNAMSGGQLLTVVAATPIAHLGSGLPDAKPKAGYDVAIAFLEIKQGGGGAGELVPAAMVKVNDAGAIQTQDYAVPAVMLSGIQAKK